MKYRLILTKRFEKDVKRCVKRRLPMEKFKKVIRLLEETGKLPSEYIMMSSKCGSLLLSATSLHQSMDRIF